MSRRSRKKLARHQGRGILKGNTPRKPDLEIELQDPDPDQLSNVLHEAREAGVEVFTKTYKTDAKQLKYAKGEFPASGVAGQTYYENALHDTHSLGISPHPKGWSIANQLMHDAQKPRVIGMDEKVDISSGRERFLIVPKTDDRPLIDLLHEATFTNPLGISPIKDLYALRMILRKAHCFTLNEATSAMVADFSMATLPDLEASRQMAIPPFPVTWIELDNFARLKRMFALKAPLEKYNPDDPPVKKIGWLIHPAPEAAGYYATYVAGFENDIWVAPMSYWWHTSDPNPDKPRTRESDVTRLMEWLLFGTAGNVGAFDAFPHPSHLHHHYSDTPPKELIDAMSEMAGELRHIWGFLIALGAGHLGASAQYSAQALPATTPPIMKNGKPLLPLEHKVLHLHLNKKTPAKIIAQCITHHHNRRHDVRAHWRQLKSGKRVPVKSHQRGDELLGRIEKTYRVER